MARRILTRLSVALLAMATPVVGWELYLRWFDPVRYLAPPSPVSREVWTHRIYQPSSIEGLNYEVAPNRDVEVGSIHVRTNSLGMRDDEPRPLTDHLTRIAIVGDSYTFGYGVEVEDTFCDRLEAMLNADPDLTKGGRTFDVLNFGVGGYSTRDEAIVLAERALPMHPALVIVAYVLNDPEIEAIQPLHTFFAGTKWWQHSEVLRYLAQRRHKEKVLRLGGGSYTRSLYGEPKKWQSVLDGFDSMVASARAAGVPIGLVVFPDGSHCTSWKDYGLEDLHARVIAAANAAGFTFTRDLLDVFTPYDPLSVRVAPVDEHPNALGHELTAKALLELVRAQLP